MRTFFFVILLAGNVSFGDSISVKATEPPTATQILDAWERRESSFKSGKISWTVPGKNWNIFGFFETDWVPDSSPVDQEITGTLSFTDQTARYDSFSFSYKNYGYPSTPVNTTGQLFKKSIRSKFLFRDNGYCKILPYTVIFSPEDSLLFWHGNEKEYSRAIILPAAFKSESLPAMSTKFTLHEPLTLHQLLAAPAMLTFRPLLYDRSLVQEDTMLEVDERQPTYEGRPCVVLRVRYAPEVIPTDETETANEHNKPAELAAVAGTEDQAAPPAVQQIPSVQTVPTIEAIPAVEAPPTAQAPPAQAPPAVQAPPPPRMERIYWVDPSRDFVVVRCIDMINDKPVTQIDIHYDQVADIGWVPNAWTVLRFGHQLNVVQRIVTAVRTDIDTGQSISAARMKISFPPKTYVINTLEDQRYIVGDDLSKWTYADLLASQRGSMKLGKSYRGLVGLFKWPGVLIPVSLIFVILIAINAWLVRRRALRSASEEPQMDTQFPAKVIDKRLE